MALRRERRFRSGAGCARPTHSLVLQGRRQGVRCPPWAATRPLCCKATIYARLKTYMDIIRQANPADAAAIKALVSETVLRCVAEDEDSYRRIFGEICTVLDSWVESPKDTVHLVCERDDEIVGVVLISQYEKMNLLFVHPAYQKVGVGTSLLDSALEVCRLSGKSDKITLNSSRHAAPFYLKHGFVPNGAPRDLPGGCVPLAFDL